MMPPPLRPNIQLAPSRPSQPAAPAENRARGFFITLEGIDGAGKSSHFSSLSQALQAAGRSVLQTREPGGTALAETLRTLVLSNEMDALTEALLVFAARRDHLQNVIQPALARGCVVLCDRFTDASYAYQCGGRGLDIAILQQLESLVHPNLQPDLSFYFNLPPELAAQRRLLAQERQERSAVPDRFEQETLDFFQRVHAGYLARIAQYSQRFVQINASASPAAVFAELQAACFARLPSYT